MASAVVEKTEEELRKEINELDQQQKEIAERLRDRRLLRRAGLSAGRGRGRGGPRSFFANGGPQRGFVRPAERNDAEDQPPPKRRISSAVVKIEEGEIAEDVVIAPTDANKEDLAVEGSSREGTARQNERPSNWLRRDGNHRASKLDSEVPPPQHVPRVLPKNEDPKLVSRNKRMLGQLLGTLEKFQKEDMQLSGTEAFMRRSDSLKRAEQRAREESKRLREQEREQLEEKLKRDLTLKARLAAKAQEKSVELLFPKWCEHHKKLASFTRRTKAEPHIFYSFAKPLEEDLAVVDQKRDQVFQEWKASRREELLQYHKQIAEQYVADAEVEFQNMKRKIPNNNTTANLQETMDKELETHRLEHGPKTRKIPSGSNNEDEDVEDINVGEDDMMDDVLEVDDNNQKSDETVKGDAGNGSPQIDNNDHNDPQKI